MKPALFSFKLTVPRDPALAEVVADVVSHAVNYAGLNPEAGAAIRGQGPGGQPPPSWPRAPPPAAWS